MAQNVVIAGSTWNDVPAVDFNKSGGGTARFVDTSDADAAAGDIAYGKKAYVNGNKITGTNQGYFYETVPVSAWYQQTPDVNEEYWYAADITPADFDPNEQDVSVCAADGNAYKWLSENAFYELNIGTAKFSIQAKAIPSAALHVFYELKTRGES